MQSEDKREGNNEKKVSDPELKHMVDEYKEHFEENKIKLELSRDLVKSKHDQLQEHNNPPVVDPLEYTHL
ncbi:hypothetical protein ABK040_004083 [Willaertia magna]